MDTVSASRGASGALASGPVASTAKPPRMGNQMARLSRWSVSSMTSAVQEKSNEQEHAQDHGKGIVVHVTRLDVTYHRGHPPHHARRAVDREAVNQLHIADAPEPPAAAAGAARDHQA